MFGTHWTRRQKTAYRSAFSMERIVDEIWLLIGLGWMLTCAVGPVSSMAPNAGCVVVFVGGFVALGAVTYPVAPWLLRRTMPEELRESLPDDRCSGILSPRAPRTYRELLQRWCMPARPTRG